MQQFQTLGVTSAKYISANSLIFYPFAVGNRPQNKA